MSQEVARTVSTESGMWLDGMRKSLATLRRAIPKDLDPSIKVQPINDYRVKLTAEWSEWL